MNVTVFSTGPGCGKCITTKAHLTKRNIPFTEIRLDLDRNQAVELRKQGFNLSPVVKVEKDGVIQMEEGYRPDFLDSLTG